MPDMTISGASRTNSNPELLRRLDILIGLLAVITALLGVLVAHIVSESFIPAFLLILLFGLGVVTLARSLRG